MNTKWLTVFALAAVVPLAGAQTQTATPVAASPASDVAATATAVPGRTIYAARLPAATELTSAAAAQGLTIDKIEQTATQVTVTYRASTGATSVVAYQLLPAANAAAAGVVSPTPAPMVVTPAPRVVYYEPAYRYYPGYAYDPWYWYPPVSFRFGVSYGFRGGYFRGGVHHWR